jgi:uncharacterized membrane protein SirB2
MDEPQTMTTALRLLLNGVELFVIAAVIQMAADWLRRKLSI